MMALAVVFFVTVTIPYITMYMMCRKACVIEQ